MQVESRFIETYGAGEPVFEEGSQGAEMFVVLSGQVAIMRGRPGDGTVLATLGAGEMFGEMALVDEGTRSASAYATQDGSRVVRIDQARFVYLVSQQPAFALGVMRAMARRLAGKPAADPVAA